MGVYHKHTGIENSFLYFTCVFDIPCEKYRFFLSLYSMTQIFGSSSQAHAVECRHGLHDEIESVHSLFVVAWLIVRRELLQLATARGLWHSMRKR